MRSVHADNRDNCAVLGVWNDGPKLNWNWNDNDNPIYGAASRGEFLRPTGALNRRLLY